MKILIAPDSFKGSLTSVQVAEALARGWRHGRHLDEILLSPLADGGEGTLNAVAAAGGWLELPAAARDPLGEPLRGRFLRRSDEAVVELATASGLSLLAPDRLDAMAASTFGTGLIVAAAIGLGCRRIVLGLGGSATTDGGAGLLVALGTRFFDSSGADLPMGGGALAQLAEADMSGLSPVLGEVSLTIASDVTNPLLGELGAAATYGPQKGADPDGVAALDAALTRYANVLEAATGREVRDVPGAGAAGGTTCGLLAIADRFAHFEVRSGADVAMDLTGFADGLASSDLVLTGEGRVDRQTGFGKTALVVSRRAAALGRPCIAFCGGATVEGIEALRQFAVVVPVTEAPTRLEDQIALGAAPLERAAERAARLVSIGQHG